MILRFPTFSLSAVFHVALRKEMAPVARSNKMRKISEE
jgi:hypothetical protein